MKNSKTNKQYVVCTYRRNDEELLFGKIYTVLPDKKAEEEGLLRIIDESGEDYLYPQKYFASVQLSTAALAAFSSKG